MTSSTSAGWREVYSRQGVKREFHTQASDGPMTRENGEGRSAAPRRAADGGTLIMESNDDGTNDDVQTIEKDAGDVVRVEIDADTVAWAEFVAERSDGFDDAAELIEVAVAHYCKEAADFERERLEVEVPHETAVWARLASNAPGGYEHVDTAMVDAAELVYTLDGEPLEGQ